MIVMRFPSLLILFFLSVFASLVCISFGSVSISWSELFTAIRAGEGVIWDVLFRLRLPRVVTATNSFITKPIAEEFGIENLIATEPEQIEGEFTGGVVGLPSFREGKVTRVHEWLHSIGRTWESFDETIFFSDSINDLPLLNEVLVTVVVDPDINLLQHAKSVGWEVLSLRDEP